MKRTKRGERLKMALGSGNVYADLGFKDADAMLVKAFAAMSRSSSRSPKTVELGGRRGVCVRQMIRIAGLTS